MVKSTSFLINDQCDLINENSGFSKGTGLAPTKRKRVHNILSEQLASLHHEARSRDVDGGPQTVDSQIGTAKPEQEQATGKPEAKRKSEHDNLRSGVLIKRPKLATKAAKKTPGKQGPKGKISDQTFIDLLTGDTTAPETEVDPTFKIREQICQSHVMKSLGGYKFLENNKFDNFVISILPRMENSKVISKY